MQRAGNEAETVAWEWEWEGERENRGRDDKKRAASKRLAECM